MRITIKLGGSILEDTGIRTHLLEQISRMASQGHEILLVHGGGKSLNRRLSQMQMTSQFIEGLRVTDAETLQVAVMVLAGEVNKRIVAEMSRLGTRALGICGADAGAVRCVRLEDLPGNPQGIGFVGKPTAVNLEFFEMVLHSGTVPVISSIAMGADSQLYNVNADQMASACAAGARCHSLIYLTDVPGVRDGDGAVLKDIGKAEILSMRLQGILSGGMLPKTSSCLEALEAGVSSVHILPGAGRDILTKFFDGSLSEGTKIHGNS
ncbi:MAG: acetylglutamate kinase [Acidobacteria bacterium]|nr:acetylglutamate kinase [Acidobacteriota bacterium]